MRAGAKQVISQDKPRKSVRRRVLELVLTLPESRGRKLRHRGQSASRENGSRESLRGWDAIGSGTGVGSGPDSRGQELPAAAGPGPCVPALYLGLPAACGRSLGRLSGRPAPGSRRPMSPLGPSRFPRRPHRAPGAGTSRGRQRRVLQPEVTGTGSLSAAGCSPSRRGPDSSAVGTAAAAPPRRSGRRPFPRGAGRPCPARPGSPGPGAAAAAAATPSAGPARRVLGALAGTRVKGGGGRRRWGAARRLRARARVPVPALCSRPRRGQPE